MAIVDPFNMPDEIRHVHNCHHPVERRQRCDFADQSARAAVKHVFEILGVNVDDPKQVEEFRKDLRFGQSMRHLAGHSLLAMTLAAAAFAGAAFWAGLKLKIHG